MLTNNPITNNPITNTVQAHKADWVDGLARFGYAAIGVVYCLTGGLTAMAAFGMKGGQTADQQDIFRFILKQPMGRILLALVALGMVGYVVWQLVQTIKDPRHSDSDKTKGFGRRAGYAFSAFVYGSLAFYAFKMVMGEGGKSGGDGRETMVAKALSLPMGKWLVLLAAAGTIGFGLYQIFKGVSGKFMKYLEKGNVEPHVRTLIERTGRVGYIARGIVFSIIGYLMGKAAMTYNPETAGDTENAFQFIRSSSFPFLMGIVALGLLCYGLFMFVRARYQNFPV